MSQSKRKIERRFAVQRRLAAEFEQSCLGVGLDHSAAEDGRTEELLVLLRWIYRVLAALREDRFGDRHVEGVLRAVLNAMNPKTNPRFGRALREIKAVRSKEGRH